MNEEMIFSVAWTEQSVEISLDFTTKQSALQFASLLRWRNKSVKLGERAVKSSCKPLAMVERKGCYSKLEPNGWDARSRSYPKGRWS